MKIEITDTIRNVDESEWEHLVETGCIEQSYNWYKTVEDSDMRNMHYVLIREKEELKAAACCFSFEKTQYHVIMRFLYVQSPLTKAKAFFSKTGEQADILMKGLMQIQKKEGTKGFLILNIKKEEYCSVKNQLKGFAGFPINEDMYIDLNFSDFDDYLSFLGAKARRSVRSTLNRGRRTNIRMVCTKEISKWKEVLCRLNRYTCEHHNDYRGFLTDQFYEALEKNLKEEAELLMCFKDDIPLAFGISLNSPAVCRYNFGGTDPRYREYHAYFLIYYEGIRKAIEKGQKRIYFGPTTYAFKEKIGCSKEEHFGFIKMKNPFLDLMMKSYITGCRIKGRKPF
jgi:predicted N-acyltransferase